MAEVMPMWVYPSRSDHTHVDLGVVNRIRQCATRYFRFGLSDLKKSCLCLLDVELTADFEFVCYRDRSTP
jgi:hypothetical protein